MKDKLHRFIRWCEPLVTEKDQLSGSMVASVGKIMGWLTFCLDVGVVIYVVAIRKGAEVPHAELVFNFLEMLTLFILSYMFSHKLILLKGKFSTLGTGGDSNDAQKGGDDGGPGK